MLADYRLIAAYFFPYIINAKFHFTLNQYNNSKLISNYISAITSDKTNNIWIGTDVGLIRFDGKRFTAFTTRNSPLPSTVITSIVTDINNRKWIGTENGLVVYDDQLWTNMSSYLPSLNITTIKFDRLGNLWIGTQNGLVRNSNGNWETLTTKNSGLKKNFITCLAFDISNTAWIGSPYSGISVYDGKSWNYFNTSNVGIQYQTLEYVQSLAIDSRGIVWISALNPEIGKSYLLYYDGNKWSRYSNRPFINNLTYTIYVKDQLVLYGNKNGLAILNNDSGVMTSYDTANSSLPLFRLQSMMIDNFNNIWVGTFINGLGKFKNGNF